MPSDGDQSDSPELACPRCASPVDLTVAHCPRCGLAVEQMDALEFRPSPTPAMKILAAIFLILAFLVPLAAMVWYIFR